MPITSLESQLKKLQTPQTSLFTHSTHKASFLFDSAEAARLDRDAFYDIGLSGLEELIKLNPLFGSFETTLFDVTSKSFERAVESQETNDKLNFHIKTFLTLLSPYFLLKSAHKALEWLINRYHIHRFNVSDLMFLILPYHETILFAKMLQIIPLRDSNTSNWFWLGPVKKEGVPLSKTALLTRASKDMAFLKFVCNMPTEAIKVNGNRAQSLTTLYAFYCTTVIGGLEFANHITELHITHILPSLMAALGSTIPDFTASGFMIIARLATKACLSEKILEGLFNKISKVDHAKLHSETSLVLVLLCQNAKAGALPEKAVRRLAEAEWFIPSLKTITENKILALPFICWLLRGALALIMKGSQELQVFVQNLLSHVLLDPADAEEIFKCLLDGFANGCDESILGWYSGIFRDFEKSFPKVFDSIASEVLKSRSEKASAMETLLGVNAARTDFYEKLVHPEPSIRVVAIKNIVKSFKPEQLSWLRQSLLERFKDEDPLVISELLRLPVDFIDSFPEEALLSHLLRVVTNHGGDSSILKPALVHLMRMFNEENSARIILTLTPILFKIAPLLKTIEIPESAKFFHAIRSGLDSKEEESTLNSIIWSALTDPDVLPTYDVVLSTFESLDYLKEKSEYWFATAILVATSVPEHPNETVVKTVIEFLVNYLSLAWVKNSLSEPLSADNLEKVLKRHKKPKILVEGPLYCLSSVTSKSLTQIKQPGGKWFQFESRNHALSLYVYKVIHEGLKFRSVSSAFDRVRTEFFKNHFTDPSAHVVFLLNALIYDPSLGIGCIDYVHAILSSREDLIIQALTEESVVIPSLLILLTSESSEVRAKVVAVLDLLKSANNHSSMYQPLIESLVDRREELVQDPEQIGVLAYSMFSPDKEVRATRPKALRTSMKTILQHLFDIITVKSTPMIFVSHLLRILAFVQSQELFMELQPLAIDLLDRTRPLKKEESSVLTLILERFNTLTAACLTEKETWDFLEKSLSDQKPTVHLDQDKRTSPAAILINQVTKELFDNIPSPKLANQEKFLNLIVLSTMESETSQVVSACASMFKKLLIDCQILSNLLTPMLTATPQPIIAGSHKLRPRSRVEVTPSLEVLESIDWKRGVYLLQLIQNKKKLTSVPILLPTLFNILKRCLQYEEQGPVEYTKQLVLSTIIHCCERLKITNEPFPDPETLQVDLVVNCVRASLNPQTHNHALLALNYLAHVVPDQVLHNTMAIFTFIGSSVLRQDDGYSFQIIAKTIDTVIPVLIKSHSDSELKVAVAGVLRVFVAAMLDIPEHRRLALLSKLMSTMKRGEFLWIFLCLVFEIHVTRPLTPSNSADPIALSDEPNKRLEIALELCAEFAPSVILNNSLALLAHINALPHEKLEEVKVSDKLLLALFNIEANTAKQLRHYKYALMSFLSSLLSSTHFVQKMAETSDEEIQSFKTVFSQILQLNLVYVKEVLKKTEMHASLPVAKYWKVILNIAYDILDKVNALLPTDMFLHVVHNLLQDPLEAVRRKAMELLGWRLQQPRPVPTDVLIGLLPFLVSSVETITQDGTSPETQCTQQTALFALKLMARHLALLYIDQFKNVLGNITEIISWESPTSWPVLGSLVLCLGELVSTLKSHSLPYLAKFMPAVISLLHNFKMENGGELFLVSIITAVLKIVESIAQFLSPYLTKLLYEISLLSCKYSNEIGDSLKSQPLYQKLKTIRSKLSSDVPNRVIVPAVAECFAQLIANRKYEAVSSAMSVLSDGFTSGADLTAEASDFFFNALQFRCSVPDMDLSLVESVENPVISALTVLVLKLPETGFRPFYNRLFEWSSLSEEKERAITFYRLSLKIADSLKRLFNLFAGVFISNAAELLDLNNSKVQMESYFDEPNSTAKSCLLIDNILSTLHIVFSTDSHQFVTKERFNVLMHPLVNQLENELGGDDVWAVRCEKLLIPCLAQMSRSIQDDSLWKQLNNQILLKTRNPHKEIRIAALKTVCSLTSALGEDFLPLLPETVPFLAELLEDDEEEVEKECRRVVNEMEEILGEPIQKYF